MIASQSHPLAGRQGLTLADLAEQRFILRERGSGTRLACDAHFQQVGFVPQVWVELGSNEAIKQTVASEMGLSVISRHALAPIVEHEQLAVLDVQGFPLQSNWWTLYPGASACRPWRRCSSPTSMTWPRPGTGSASRSRAPPGPRCCHRFGCLIRGERVAGRLFFQVVSGAMRLAEGLQRRIA